MALITEDHLEKQCLEWLKELGYAYAFAPHLAPDGTSPECTDFRQVILTGRLRSALQLCLVCWHPTATSTAG
jgi:type I restriction enzyme R subunit